ncbi:MAG: stalk domain-containing protein [Thermacetogeniaceae bacterium]
MRWRQKIVFLVAIAVCLVATYTGGGSRAAGAAEPVSVFVNSQQAQFPDVQPAIIDGRTLVPLRFIAEAPAFGALVSYDSATNQVTLLRGLKTVLLWPSNNTVVVDGKKYTTDVAPVIMQGRTLVPIRFLSETFGATVAWDASTRAVSINIGAPARLVMGYYYGSSYSEFLARHASLTDVAFQWYEVDDSGALTVKTPDSYRLAVDFADQNGVRTEASVSLSDPQKLHTLLSSEQARSTLVGNLTRLAQQEGYQSINLDLESVASADKTGYLSLLAQLSQTLRRAGIGFLVAVPAKDSEKPWNDAYDYGAIAGYADRIVLMAYDFHYKTSAPGALAPYTWVTGVLAYARQFFPAQQIILGIGLYGYDWPDGKNATSLDSADADALAAAHGVQPVWDNNTSAPHFDYTDAAGIKHEVWYENRPSLAMKLNLAKSQGLAGISIWRLGYGFPSFWADVSAYRAS